MLSEAEPKRDNPQTQKSRDCHARKKRASNDGVAVWIATPCRARLAMTENKFYKAQKPSD